MFIGYVFRDITMQSYMRSSHKAGQNTRYYKNTGKEQMPRNYKIKVTKKFSFDTSSLLQSKFGFNH